MKSFSDIVAGEDWRSQDMINDGEEQMMIMGDETLTNIQKGSKFKSLQQIPSLIIVLLHVVFEIT